jgi:hypothetical protein
MTEARVRSSARGRTSTGGKVRSYPLAAIFRGPCGIGAVCSLAVIEEECEAVPNE